MFYILFVMFISMKIQTILTHDFMRVCYLRAEPEIPVNYIIEAKLCTHLIIGFVSIENNTIKVDETNDKFYRVCKSTIDEMKSETQLMISIGGGFHATALTENNRKQFADSALQIVRKYSLDGIDIDWEFPAWGTAHHNDKHTFTLLLKEMRETFDSYSRQSMGKEILLSAAVAAQYTIIERAYSAPQLIKYVNFLNLMTYDYNLFQWYWPFVGHNSPLSGPQWRVFTIFNTFNMQWSANYWHRLGVDKSKIAVGVPTYGRRFRLALPWFTAPGSPALSTSQDMTYSQICEFLRADGTTAAFDRQSGAPFAYGNNHWLTYESTQSAAQKAKWIRDEGFGGVMTFSLNADDFRGQCPDSRQFAIHSAIKDALQS